MAIETVRVSKHGRDQLIRLKSRTGIETWNILCRWAFCLSLSDKSPVREEHIVSENSIEMTWRTFAGEYEDIYWALLKQRCINDEIPIDEETLQQQFRLHLHRGIAFMMGDKDIRNISALVLKAVKQVPLI
jgi:DNA sulfur modification protein DndE